VPDSAIQTRSPATTSTTTTASSIRQAGIRIIDRLNLDHDAERERLIAGLRAESATIEPKYFYDPLGCALYGAICQLDEYYPTRTERAIFQSHRSAIADALGLVDTFIDLGAGDCCKALSWLPILEPSRYVAVDIAGEALRTALERMQPDFADTELLGLVTDFSQRLDFPASLMQGRGVVFYPGSSIGNFTPTAAVRFLREIRALLAPCDGALLIGVDAKKEKSTLDAAYDDALGVTAAFNLNALRHINRVLGSDFALQNWRHRGFYNPALGRVEMHLESQRDQLVKIDGVPRSFAVGERIHSESSYKYTRDDFVALLDEAGYHQTQVWSNAENAFWVFLALV
jgi:dimethylhistidine N-methyltransferase